MDNEKRKNLIEIYKNCSDDEINNFILEGKNEDIGPENIYFWNNNL